MRNNLNDSFEIDDDEFEHLRSEYKGGDKPDKRAKFARFLGITFLVLAVVFILQQFFFPFGPDITGVLRIAPTTGTIIVLIIGLGLFARSRRQRKSRTKNHDFGRRSKASYAGRSSYGAGESTSSGAYEREDHSTEDYDMYAFKNKKRWYRSRKERMIAGVCGGIAERFAIDPTVVRALFALALISYGTSLVIYIVLAIVLPVKPLKTANL